VDEIAIRKGHDYRIVVSDLDRRRPIWVGGTGCTEADRDLFFAALGRWKPLYAEDPPRGFPRNFICASEAHMKCEMIRL